MNSFLKKFAASAVLALLAPLAQAQSSPTTMVVGPGQPMSRESLNFELVNPKWPLFLPASRYSRRGNHFEIDLEMVSNFFGPNRPDVGNDTIPVGHLLPGSYTATTRIHDLNNLAGAPLEQTTNFEVIASDYAGLFVVPLEPRTSGEINAILVSPFFLYPDSVKLSMVGNALQISFEYVEDAWVMFGGAAPAGTRDYAVVRLPSLAAGSWRLEATGTARGAVGSVSYVPRDFEVSSTTTVVEYFAPGIDHYFMSAGAGEIAALDSGAQPGWKRTGQQFNAWLSQSQAAPGAVPVCRFYAAGPNSHFYTANASECRYLRDLEAKGKTQSAASNQPFLGWTYEGVAFWAMGPVAGKCPQGSDPVYRSFNKRADQGDSNHRFTADPLMHSAMSFTWADEGIAFCSPR